MYIKNKRNNSKIKAYGLYQSLLLTENSGLRNRSLFKYYPLKKRSIGTLL